MANDVEIRVRVANQSGAGLAATTQALTRLKGAAREAGTAVARLREQTSRDITLRVSLDNTTDRSFAQLKGTIQELKSGGPIRIRAQLDNQTAAAFTTLKATISELKSAGTIRLRVGLTDETRAGIAAAKAGLRELKAASPVRLEARFSGNAGEVAATARAMRDLRAETSRASTAMSSLAPRAIAAAAALELVEQAAESAGRELRTLRGRATAATTALQELRDSSTALSTSLRSVSRSSDSAGGRMETLASRTSALRERMAELTSGLASAGTGLSGLRGSLGSVSSSADRAGGGMNRLLGVAIALSPALIPLTAALAPVAAGMAAAGVATLAFTAALIPQFKAIGEVSKAQEKYTKAVDKYGPASKQAARAEEAWLEQVSETGPATLKAAAGLSVLGAAYRTWSEGLSESTMPVVTKGFAVLGGLLPKLAPLVQGAAGQFDRLMSILGGAIRTPGFDRLMAQLTTFSTEVLARAISGLVRFGQAMREGGSARNGLSEFMDYARAVGPVVGETLRNLGEMLRRLLVAASSTGVGLLTVINAFAELVNAVPMELLTRLVQVAVAFKLVTLASAGLTAIGPRLMAAGAAAATFGRNAMFVGVATSIRNVAASMTLLQRSTVVLGVIAAVVMAISELSDKAKGAPPDVDKLTDSLKRLGMTGQFTGELKRTFGDMDGFVQRIQEMREAAGAFDRTKSMLNFAPMGPAIEKAAHKLEDLVRGTKSLSATQRDVKAFDESFAQLAKSGHADLAAEQFKQFEAALRSTGLTTQEIAAIFPQYQAALTSLQAEQELTARSMGLFGEQAVAVQAKLDAQKQSADGLRQSIQALNDVNRQALGGMIGFEAAIDAAAEAAKKNAGALTMSDGALDLNSEKARTAASALQDLASKTDEAAAAARSNGSSWETVSGIYERGREKLLESAQAMGLTKAQAASLAAQILSTPDKTAYLRGDMADLQSKLNAAKERLASVPDSRKAQVRAEIADLEAKISRARAQLSGLSDRTVYIRTFYQEFRSKHHTGQADAHGGIIGAAAGGPRSRLTLVGEQGPELVDLAPGSRVRSNPDSRRIADGMAAAGGGGGTAVIELHSSGNRVDDLLVEILRRSIRAKGGDVQIVLGDRRTGGSA